MNDSKRTVKQLTVSIILSILIVVCLSITTFAIVYSMVSVESNLFTTGKIQINLNGGETLINQEDYLLEPGATVKKDFFIKNESTCDIYYRLYFQNVSGGLADVLTVKICDGEKVLAEGTPSKLTRENVSVAEHALSVGEKKELQIYFHFPEDAGNTAQNQSLFFDFAADAVQTKNNPDKFFD